MEQVPTELTEEVKSRVNVDDIKLPKNEQGPGVSIGQEEVEIGHSEQMAAIEAQKKALFFGGVVFGVIICGGSYLAWTLFKKMKETQ